jgi:hypothetical protein
MMRIGDLSLKVIRYLEHYPCFERFGSVKVPKDHFGPKARAIRSMFAFPRYNQSFDIQAFRFSQC